MSIPPEEQPADHYRLLGVPRFSSDLDVIEIAADRQMRHVRTFQTGKHSVASQQLLNALAAARVCLLNAQSKAAYDAQAYEKLRALFEEKYKRAKSVNEKARAARRLDEFMVP